ncbi:hypothetical protein L2E82_20065 [Cichorium intybus]|uniref:Uncharacterized protein n=1 Tax=Cichorium intybus TaxID=13427 RepID=A0ACB9DRZ6_CICIN|nr:hypothetical protein L2E82_20065 [Cichorium intybus]
MTTPLPAPPLHPLPSYLLGSASIGPLCWLHLAASALPSPTTIVPIHQWLYQGTPPFDHVVAIAEIYSSYMQAVAICTISHEIFVK